VITSCKKVRRSARALGAALDRAGYSGPPINLGWSDTPYVDCINKPDAVATAANKRIALWTLEAAGVPTLLVGDTFPPDIFPVVGRPDYHREGRHFYVCSDYDQVWKASLRQRPVATHFQRLIVPDHEFRVHIVHGQSIKISEKFGGGNHAAGASFHYPHDFHHKKTLRRTAKAAVAALGLDFGAVDVLWKDQPYVLEVNSAPGLSDPHSDTLTRYVDAFMYHFDCGSE
jgi:hypothetical protein